MELSINRNFELMSLMDLLEKHKKVVIPSIQRDYVLGGNELYFKDLLDDMRNSKDKSFFDFSCIIGHEENGVFYVYDGQQRITTLVFMVAKRIGQKKSNRNALECSCDKTDAYIEMLIRKFQFEERKESNLILDKLLQGEDINEIEKHVQTSNLTVESIKKMMTYDKIEFISISFLMGRVKFKLTQIEEKGTSEQLFLDLNEGVILEDYEIFKSELDYRIKKICKNSLNDLAENWSRKIDNEWLDWFFNILHNEDTAYKDNLKSIEKTQMDFIRYCIKMVYIEKNIIHLMNNKENNTKNDLGKFSDFKSIGLKWLDKDENFSTREVYRVFNIMEALFKLDKNDESNKKNDESNKKNDFYINVGNQNKKGGTRYINLKYEEYYKNITSMIKNLESKKWNAVEEIFLWIYLSSFAGESHNKEVINEYLRLIKKIINRNRRLNEECFYYNNGYGQIYEDFVNYARKHVVGLYSENDYNSILLSIIDFNMIDVDLNKESQMEPYEIISDRLKRYKRKVCDPIEPFKDILNDEIKKYDSYSQCKDLIRFEDHRFFNGLIHNIVRDENGKYGVGGSFNDFRRIIEKNDLRTHLYILQVGVDEMLLNKVSCDWGKGMKMEWYTPYRELTDLMTCDDDITPRVLQKYIFNLYEVFSSKIANKNTSLKSENYRLARIFNAPKSNNREGTGYRERMFCKIGEELCIIRPMHRGSSGYVDQTAAFNKGCIECIKLDTELDKYHSGVK